MNRRNDLSQSQSNTTHHRPNLNLNEFSNLFKHREEGASVAELHRTNSAVLRFGEVGAEDIGYVVPLTCGHRGMFLEKEKLYLDRLIEESKFL